MKRILKNRAIWSVMATLFLLYSCSDSFLEVKPTGSLNSSLLSGKLGIDFSLLAAYSQVNGRDNRMASPSNWVWGSVRGGEANKGTDPGDFSTINPIQRFEALSTLDVVNDKYNGNYEGVARCNSVMKLLLTPGPDVTPADITSLSAQARFLRAHFYFELARGYNQTPYVDETVDYGTGIELVKNDVSLWPKIEEDMKFAYDNLPVTQTEIGRVHKWAAAAYLAKIYMYEGKFADAKALFDLLIPAAYGGTGTAVTVNNKTFGLNAKYADSFKASNDNSLESVWAYQAAANTGSVNNANPEFDLNWPYNTGADGPGNCCSFFQPTFEMGNSFRTLAGLPLVDDGAGAYDPAYNLPANELKTDMGLEVKDAFVPDAGPVDPRLDHSIGRRGIPYLDWQDFPGKSWIRNQPNAGPYQTKKFVYYKSDKGTLQDNSTWTPGYTAINYNIIRFADVMLMAAEAEFEVGSPTRALELVNFVRARAANADGFVMKGAVPAANYVISQYPGPWAKDAATLEKIRFERKLELSGEGHRFYDLARWSGLYGATHAVPTPDYIDKVLNAYLTYESVKLGGAFGGSTFNSPKDRYLPIPQGQIDLLGPDILTQNPGF